MRLSIITINYNDAEGLRKTFKSIKNQTYHDFEYVVVDGNSNDGSKEVINEYKECIDKWVSEPDTGIYNAMNKGARMSSGEYMLFLNSGDYLYSNDVLDNLFSNTFKEDIICCSMHSYDDHNNHLCIPPQNVTLYTFIGGSMLHPSTLISKKIFDKVGGYNEDYKVISDWCFFVDCMIVHNCSYQVISNIVLTSFNKFGISSTNTDNKRSIAQEDFLKKRFPRIIDDYVNIEDEAISNSVLYISHLEGSLKLFVSLPFRFFNSILKLRRKLNRRTLIQ